MGSLILPLTALLLFFLQTTTACVYFNATLNSNNALTVDMWDDANQDRIRQSSDPTCTASNLACSGSNHWSVPCVSNTGAQNTTLEVYLDAQTKHFLRVVYRYLNPSAADRQVNHDPEFIFTWEAGSVDGEHFKTRQFCDDVLYDLGLFHDGCDIGNARKLCA
ncbi:Hypothetical predicted protein [Lecanosticta acicola]|uniref:Secreted protein n=1 Tax=Lecanosticta acicola TaxID=111012 RepID=A0AAI9EE19_9PEZI|nr:Hypothetical predicted protein [Lecanosticta acicola]